MSALPSRSRHAATLVELLGAMALAALLAGLTVPPSLRLVDRIVVRSAIDAIASACALARGAAVMRGVRAVVTIDTALAAVHVTVAGDTLLDRVLDPGGPLTVTASRVEVVYAPTGLGYGASNTTVLARRGSAADTLFTSRLGRVRH